MAVIPSRGSASFTPGRWYVIKIGGELAADPARIGVELATDPLVAPLVRQRPGLRIPGAWDAFECAVRAVLGQQVSVAAGRTFAARLVERAGVAIRGGADGLTHLFPTAASLVRTS